MQLINHADVLPWQVDSAFFLHLTELVSAVVLLLALAGLAYAAIHRLLSNRRAFPAAGPVTGSGSQGAAAGPVRTFESTCLEGKHDEA